MRAAAIGQRDGFELTAAERERLDRHCERAVRAARRRGEVLASITIALDAAVDPLAVIAASRRPGEPWFAMEQPDAEGFALAAAGCARAIEATGADRFEHAARTWHTLAADAVADPVDGPRGGGPVALGGFAFAPDGAAAADWEGFAAASLHVPEVAIVRRGGEVRLTVCVLCHPDDDAAALSARAAGRVAGLRSAPLPLLDPSPVEAARVASAMPPEHYVGAVERAVERIRAGELEKVVLAREVLVHAGRPHDAAAVLGVVREAFPSCFVFAVGRGEKAFVAASPELLVRRQGQRASTLALAGTTRRSADPAVDDHLGEQLLRSGKDREEQAIVIRSIEQTLRPHAVWVAAAEEPVVVKMANVQHLATPIRAQLRHPVGAVELAGALHPTPAVGGEPFAVAEPLIPALEGFDRGWYAGPVGWTDALQDGEFCVALRCALLSGRDARCYAGVGVVAESDPQAELAETEAKLGALLPVLSA
ncbi:MAG: isochorismate synthase [Solirubrobacterales bacterium]|nr:isochorismate synthase [Solirubrobacterales bacterium]